MQEYYSCKIYKKESNMDIFYNKIKDICAKNEKVAMFIDMDGTIVEYKVYKDGELTTSTKGIFLNGEPIKVVINNLKRISEIPNIDLYILTLSKSNIIVEETPTKRILRLDLIYVLLHRGRDMPVSKVFFSPPTTLLGILLLYE